MAMVPKTANSGSYRAITSDAGMTGAQFARFVGVRYSTLMYWLKKRRKETGQGEQVAPPRSDHPRWLEARGESQRITISATSAHQSSHAVALRAGGP